MNKHTIQGAIRSLTKKGCIITEETPLTRRETRYAEITEAQIKKRAKEIGLSTKEIEELSKIGKLMITLGITPERIPVDVVVQEPFTVNIGTAEGLGNKSWGKIDFLKNYANFKVVKNPLYGTERSKKTQEE